MYCLIAGYQLRKCYISRNKMHECEVNRAGWVFLSFETDFERVLEQNYKNIIKWRKTVYLDWA